jgi:hypothetical protein
MNRCMKCTDQLNILEHIKSKWSDREYIWISLQSIHPDKNLHTHSNLLESWVKYSQYIIINLLPHKFCIYRNTPHRPKQNYNQSTHQDIQLSINLQIVLKGKGMQCTEYLIFLSTVCTNHHRDHRFLVNCRCLIYRDILKYILLDIGKGRVHKKCSRLLNLQESKSGKMYGTVNKLIQLDNNQ